MMQIEREKEKNDRTQTADVHSNAQSPVLKYLENWFSIVLIRYMLFEHIHRLCSHKYPRKRG